MNKTDHFLLTKAQQTSQLLQTEKQKKKKYLTTFQDLELLFANIKRHGEVLWKTHHTCSLVYGIQLFSQLVKRRVTKMLSKISTRDIICGFTDKRQLKRLIYIHTLFSKHLPSYLLWAKIVTVSPLGISKRYKTASSRTMPLKSWVFTYIPKKPHNNWKINNKRNNHVFFFNPKNLKSSLPFSIYIYLSIYRYRYILKSQWLSLVTI